MIYVWTFLVCSSPELLVIAHGIPHLTIIATNQPVFNTVRPSPLNQCNVTVNSVQLPGPGTRRQERKITFAPNNNSVSLIELIRDTQKMILILLLIRSASGGREKGENCLPGHLLSGLKIEPIYSSIPLRLN